MAMFIISGSRGTDDPTMATLPFMAAKTAREQGHDVMLWAVERGRDAGTERCG
jgi:predicted peroxiredoxin